jgi:hypothetical protein
MLMLIYNTFMNDRNANITKQSKTIPIDIDVIISMFHFQA